MNTRITGGVALTKYVDKLSKTMKSPKDLTGKVAVLSEQDVLKHFKDSEGPQGQWKPLSYRKGKPLRKGGRLMRSISKSYDNKSASVGTNIDYAAPHNFGYRYIPKREFIWLSGTAYKKIEKELVKILEHK